MACTDIVYLRDKRIILSTSKREYDVTDCVQDLLRELEQWRIKRNGKYSHSSMRLSEKARKYKG